jgi:sugar lactone lactonase YvrE
VIRDNESALLWLDIRIRRVIRVNLMIGVIRVILMIGVIRGMTASSIIQIMKSLSLFISNYVSVNRVFLRAL